jgi:hypothetical protein
MTVSSAQPLKSEPPAVSRVTRPAKSSTLSKKAFVYFRTIFACCRSTPQDAVDACSPISHRWAVYLVNAAQMLLATAEEIPGSLRYPQWQLI